MARGIDRDRWSDFELLSAAGKRDGAAFGVFYGRHLSTVVAYLRRQTGDPALTADLTAEVFAAALRSGHRYRDSSESAGPWLLGIAANLLRMSRRRGRIEDRARRRLSWEPVALEDPDLEPLSGSAEPAVPHPRQARRHVCPQSNGLNDASGVRWSMS